MSFLGSTVKPDDTRMVTLKAELRNSFHFQIYTTDHCSIMPFKLYKNASRKFELTGVTTETISIMVYRVTLPAEVDKVIVLVQKYKIQILQPAA